MIKTCIICGKQFDALRFAKTCSPECRTALQAKTFHECYAKVRLRQKQREALELAWLTIPDAPDYEINGELICRNKNTGKTVTMYTAPGNHPYYRLPSQAVPKGWLFRTPVSLRRQALAAAEDENFSPIPSLGDKYEINPQGVVRNARTKKTLKPSVHDVYSFYDTDGVIVYHSKASLLWEVHGIIKTAWKKQAVRAEHNNKIYSFPTCAECARFLKTKLYYSLHTLQCYLWKRKPSFAGWTFTYIDEFPAEVKWNSRALNSLAQRQAKLVASS